MGVYCWTVQLTSLILNYVCNYVVPIVETVAHKLRVTDCVCESPPHSAKRRGKGKKPRRTPARELQEELNPSEHGSEMKRIKLLLDITVDKSNSQVVDVQATPQSDNCTRHVRSSGFIVRLLNMPSSILLHITSKLRQWNWSQEMASLEVTHCCEINRIKKSPKRRISKANYRKIIPFFPFNLLGFSNYSAFQMPTLTCSKECSAECTAAEETNNLNASSVSAHGNGKSRCKRRRDSSTCEEILSLSNDFSHLEMPESHNNAITENGKEELGPQDGHDEVDSDEIPDIENTQAAPSVSFSNFNVNLEKQSPSKNNGTVDEAEADSDEVPDIEDEEVSSSSTSYLSDLNETLKKQSPSKSNGTVEEVDNDEIPDNESEEEAVPSTPLSDFNETPEKKSPSKYNDTVDEVVSNEISDNESEEAYLSGFETPETQSPTENRGIVTFNAEEGQNDKMNRSDKANPKPRYRD